MSKRFVLCLKNENNKEKIEKLLKNGNNKIHYYQNNKKLQNFLKGKHIPTFIIIDNHYSDKNDDEFYYGIPTPIIDYLGLERNSVRTYFTGKGVKAGEELVNNEFMEDEDYFRLNLKEINNEINYENALDKDIIRKKWLSVLESDKEIITDSGIKKLKSEIEIFEAQIGNIGIRKFRNSIDHYSHNELQETIPEVAINLRKFLMMGESFDKYILTDDKKLKSWVREGLKSISGLFKDPIEENRGRAFNSFGTYLVAIHKFKKLEMEHGWNNFLEVFSSIKNEDNFDSHVEFKKQKSESEHQETIKAFAEMCRVFFTGDSKHKNENKCTVKNIACDMNEFKIELRYDTKGLKDKYDTEENDGNNTNLLKKFNKYAQKAKFKINDEGLLWEN